jgi:hypothetical protein
MSKNVEIATKDQQLLERLELGRPLAAFQTRRWLRVIWWGLLGVAAGLVVLGLWQRGQGDLTWPHLRQTGYLATSPIHRLYTQHESSYASISFLA